MSLAHLFIISRCPSVPRTNCIISALTMFGTINDALSGLHNIRWTVSLRMARTTSGKHHHHLPLFSSGKRKTSGQRNRYKEQLKANLKKCEMDLKWETRADDRAYWRSTSRMGVANLEWRWITMRKEKGERTENKITTLQYVCAMCVVEYVDQQSASTAMTCDVNSQESTGKI